MGHFYELGVGMEDSAGGNARQPVCLSAGKQDEFGGLGLGQAY